MMKIGDIVNELKQYYDKKLLSRAQLDTIFMNYGVKKSIPPRGGKSIEFRRFDKIVNTYVASYTLAEGSAPAETTVTVSNVTATISQFGQYAKVSDILQTQGYDPTIAEFSDVFAISMAECLDVVVRDTLSAATTAQYADTAIQVGTSGTGSVGSGNYLDSAELLEAKRTLRRNGARPPYVCLIHPDNTKDLMEDPDIRDDFRWTDPGAIKSGNIGQWMGINFVESNNLRVRSSYGMSGADVYEVLMMGQEFYGVTDLSSQTARMIIHPLGSGGHSDPLEQYSTVGWKAALAAVILNNNFGIILYCASSRSNSA